VVEVRPAPQPAEPRKEQVEPTEIRPGAKKVELIHGTSENKDFYMLYWWDGKSFYGQPVNESGVALYPDSMSQRWDAYTEEEIERIKEIELKSMFREMKVERNVEIKRGGKKAKEDIDEFSKLPEVHGLDEMREAVDRGERVRVSPVDLLKIIYDHREDFPYETAGGSLVPFLFEAISEEEGLDGSRFRVREEIGGTFLEFILIPDGKGGFEVEFEEDIIPSLRVLKSYRDQYEQSFQPEHIVNHLKKLLEGGSK